MTLSFRRLRALCKKEIKDFSKNLNVSIVCLIPILLAFLYSQVPQEHMDKSFVAILCMTMNLVIVAALAMSMLIAEEKEKNTMRTLLLSSVSPMEFLLGKALVIMGFVLVANTVIFFIVGMPIQHLLIYTLLGFVTGLILLILGGVVGLIAENQMATGVIGTPLIMGFMLLPIMAEVNDNLRRVATLTPTYHLQTLLLRVFNGNSVEPYLLGHIMAFSAWLVIASLVFAYTYNRKGLDG